jgi:hypothetical protein
MRSSRSVRGNGWGSGKRPKAREHLTTAVTMFGEMDMRYWREQAESELAALA